MINREKFSENSLGRLNLYLFSILALTMVINIPIRAQSYIEKSRVKTVVASVGKNDTIVISQVKLDSLSNNASRFSKSLQAMFVFLGENIHYLPKAIEMKTEGDIIAGFTITERGEVVNSRILRGLCADLDKEVVRAIREMPVWKSLEEDGRKKDMDYTITVNFTLPDEDSIFVPKVSIVGVETSNLKLSVKRMVGVNCGSSDREEDFIIGKSVSIIIGDVDNNDGNAQ